MCPQRKKSEYILWGGTGQAEILQGITNKRLVAIFDDSEETPHSPVLGVPIYHGMEFEDWRRAFPWVKGFGVAIGNPYGRVRIDIANYLLTFNMKEWSFLGCHFCFDIHNETGLQILMAAHIGPKVLIGRQCIINTGANVEHDCVLGDGVEIGPGAVLCGHVVVEDFAWVGANATVLPRIRIGRDAIVGAGSVVTKDVPAGVIVKGNPAI